MASVVVGAAIVIARTHIRTCDTRRILTQRTFWRNPMKELYTNTFIFRKQARARAYSLIPTPFRARDLLDWDILYIWRGVRADTHNPRRSRIHTLYTLHDGQARVVPKTTFVPTRVASRKTENLTYIYLPEAATVGHVYSHSIYDLRV